MADSLFNILSDKDFDQPQQLVAIKGYVQRHWGQEIQAKMSNKNVVITVKSAALASTIRMHIPAIQKECDIDGKLIIKIRG